MLQGTWHGLPIGPRRATSGRPPEGISISDLTVIRLNDDLVEGRESPAPWPPPGGLVAEEDPFSPVAQADEPDFYVPHAHDVLDAIHRTLARS